MKIYNQWTRKFQNATRDQGGFVFDSERVSGYVYKILNQMSNTFEQAIFINGRWEKFESPKHSRLLQQGPPSPGQALGQHVTESPATQAQLSQQGSLGQSALRKEEAPAEVENDKRDSDTARGLEETKHRIEPLSTYASEVNGKLQVSSVEGRVMTLVEAETGPILAENRNTGEVELVQLRGGRFEVVRDADQIRDMVQSLGKTLRSQRRASEAQAQQQSGGVCITQPIPSAQNIHPDATMPKKEIPEQDDPKSFISEHRVIRIVSPPRPSKGRLPAQQISVPPKQACEVSKTTGQTAVDILATEMPPLADSSVQPSIQERGSDYDFPPKRRPQTSLDLAGMTPGETKRPTVIDFDSIRPSISEYMEYELTVRRNERILQQLKDLTYELLDSPPESPRASRDSKRADASPASRKKSRLFTTELSTIASCDTSALESRAGLQEQIRILESQNEAINESLRRMQEQLDFERGSRGVPGQDASRQEAEKARKPHRSSHSSNGAQRSESMKRRLQENKRYIQLMEEAKREGVEKELSRIRTESALKERFQRQMTKLIELECKELQKTAREKDIASASSSKQKKQRQKSK